MLSDVGGGVLVFNQKIGFVQWPDIMLVIYHWQEIVTLTLTSDCEAIV